MPKGGPPVKWQAVSIPNQVQILISTFVFTSRSASGEAWQPACSGTVFRLFRSSVLGVLQSRHVYIQLGVLGKAHFALAIPLEAIPVAGPSGSAGADACAGAAWSVRVRGCHAAFASEESHRLHEPHALLLGAQGPRTCAPRSLALAAPPRADCAAAWPGSAAARAGPRSAFPTRSPPCDAATGGAQAPPRAR